MLKELDFKIVRVGNIICLRKVFLSGLLIVSIIFSSSPYILAYDNHSIKSNNYEISNNVIDNKSLDFYYDIYKNDSTVSNLIKKDNEITFLMNNMIDVSIQREEINGWINFYIREGENTSKISYEKTTNKMYVDGKEVIFHTSNIKDTENKIKGSKFSFGNTNWKQLGNPTYTNASAQQAIKDLNTNVILFVIMAAFPSTSLQNL